MEAKSSDSFEQLIVACKSNNLAVLINSCTSTDLKSIVDEAGRNLLHIAAYNHSYQVVDFLIDYGFDVNSTNKKGTTALMYAKTKALMNKNYMFLAKLIAVGANVKQKDFFGRDIFSYLEELGEIEMINFLKNYINE